MKTCVLHLGSQVKSYREDLIRAGKDLIRARKDLIRTGKVGVHRKHVEGRHFQKRIRWRRVQNRPGQCILMACGLAHTAEGRTVYGYPGQKDAFQMSGRPRAEAKLPSLCSPIASLHSSSVHSSASHWIRTAGENCILFFPSTVINTSYSCFP